MASQPPYNPYTAPYPQQQPPGYNFAPAPGIGDGYPPQQPPPYGSGGAQAQDGAGYYGGAGGGPPPQMFPPPPVHHTFPTQNPPMGEHDFEANLIKPNNLSFDNKSVRAAFVRKVFLLLMCMLLLVVGLIAIFVIPDSTRLFVRNNVWTYYLSYVVFIISYFCIICCESVRRNFPGNLICLFILTASMGYMTAMISAFYETPIVLMAMGICALCCGAIMLFACQTKYDFTSWIGVMFVVCMVLMLFGIFAVIAVVAFHVYWAYVIYAAIAALVFMIFLAIDTQMVMGGKRYEYSPEDYIVAAVQLFLDIIYIFIYLLQIIGFASKNN